jgi:hypothetical protein
MNKSSYIYWPDLVGDDLVESSTSPAVGVIGLVVESVREQFQVLLVRGFYRVQLGLLPHYIRTGGLDYLITN